MLYLFDANVLITASHMYYPLEAVPEFSIFVFAFCSLYWEVSRLVVQPAHLPRRAHVQVPWTTAALRQSKVRILAPGRMSRIMEFAGTLLHSLVPNLYGSGAK